MLKHTEIEKTNSAKQEKTNKTFEESMAINSELKSMLILQNDLACILNENSELIKDMYKHPNLSKCKDVKCLCYIPDNCQM